MTFLFDFGDQWEFEVTLEAVNTDPTILQSPRVLERHGKAPKQYAVLARVAASPARLTAVWAGLTPELQTALRALLKAGGQMSRGDFVFRFDELRP